ncbi:FAD-dependent oxidoreductase [Paenibacillus sp. P26]|nr:FAD-dependent oxidoreductase [Paenibacillus sp. P26]
MSKIIEADVIVCGGGPAGVNAAIAAGRAVRRRC